MGVLIPGLNLPSNCFDCKLESMADCDIYKGVSASKYKDKRYSKCPLIELPDNFMEHYDRLCEDKMNSSLDKYYGNI